MQFISFSNRVFFERTAKKTKTTLCQQKLAELSKCLMMTQQKIAEQEKNCCRSNNQLIQQNMLCQQHLISQHKYMVITQQKYVISAIRFF